jgi:hypothetical protein
MRNCKKCQWGAVGVGKGSRELNKAYEYWTQVPCNRKPWVSGLGSPTMRCGFPAVQLVGSRE